MSDFFINWKPEQSEKTIIYLEDSDIDVDVFPVIQPKLTSNSYLADLIQAPGIQFDFKGLKFKEMRAKDGIYEIVKIKSGHSIRFEVAME